VTPLGNSFAAPLRPDDPQYLFSASDALASRWRETSNCASISASRRSCFQPAEPYRHARDGVSVRSIQKHAGVREAPFFDQCERLFEILFGFAGIAAINVVRSAPLGSFAAILSNSVSVCALVTPRAMLSSMGSLMCCSGMSMYDKSVQPTRARPASRRSNARIGVHQPKPRVARRFQQFAQQRG